MKNGFTWAWQYSCLIVCGLSVEELAFLGAECNYYNNAISTCLPLPLASPSDFSPPSFPPSFPGPFCSLQSGVKCRTFGWRGKFVACRMPQVSKYAADD